MSFSYSESFEVRKYIKKSHNVNFSYTFKNFCILFRLKIKFPMMLSRTCIKTQAVQFKKHFRISDTIKRCKKCKFFENFELRQFSRRK